MNQSKRSATREAPTGEELIMDDNDCEKAVKPLRSKRLDGKKKHIFDDYSYDKLNIIHEQSMQQSVWNNDDILDEDEALAIEFACEESLKKNGGKRLGSKKTLEDRKKNEKKTEISFGR